MTQSSAMAHLTALASEIGPRPAGSPAHRRTESYLRQAFDAAGLHTDSVSVPFPDWALIDAALTCGGVALPVDVNPFSPPCEVTAPTMPISTLAALETADLQGRIALLYGELSQAPIFPMNFAPIQFERDQAINRLLIEKAPAAVLAVNLNPYRRQHIFEDEDFPLPSATLPTASGHELLRRGGQPVTFRISSRRRAANIATLIGHAGPEGAPRVVICAHYDTKIGTPGAQDNGTGIAAMLRLAQILPAREIPFSLDFVAWADEEYGAHTDTVYAERYGPDFGKMLCAVNLDGIGPLTQNTTITALAHSPAFEATVKGVTAGYPDVVWVEPWIQSNHYTYFSRGVPCLALSALSYERTHQADDTIAWISPERLEEAIRLVADVVTAFAGHDPAWARA